MFKKFFLSVLGFIVILGLAFTLGIFFNPFMILNRVNTFSRTSENTAIKDIYHVSFIMNQQPSGNTNILLPKMSFNDYEQATYFSEFFGITRNFIETETSYSFSDELGMLTIDKFGGHLKYESGKPPMESETIPTDQTIIEAAFLFAKEHLDYFDYEEAEIRFTDGIFEVYFIERIGNLKNYAFPTYFTLDTCANILSLDYYFHIYERLSSSPIKSMEEAFWNLPDDLGQGITVDLQKCTLVYYYTDSIVQPCYLFEGEISGGKSYRCFVRAAIFK